MYTGGLRLGHMTQQLVKKLIDSGLSEAEALVYAALLPRPSMTIQEVTNYVAIPRSTVVLALEKLVRVGVIDEYTQGKRRNFVVQSPESIQRYIDEQEKAIEAKKAKLGDLITNIRQFHFLGSATGAKVEILKGEKGFKEAYQRTLSLKRGQEILRLGVEASKFVFLPDFLKEYVAEKNRRGIRTRLILPDDPLGRETKRNDKKDSRETRYLAKKSYNPDVQVIIWGDTVSLMTWDESFETIVINSPAVVDIFTSVFEMMWKQASK